VPIKLAVLVSGRGSNLEAILKAIKAGALDASVELIIANKPGVGALEIDKHYGIRARVVDHTGLKRVEHEEKLIAELQKHPVDFIVLAGYMRVLSPYFLKHFRDPSGFFKIINIHPSMLPAFPGKDAYQDAFDAGIKESGITVHLVDEEVDHGPILAQQSFPRLENDSIDDFRKRGLAVEHKLFPQVLQKVATEGISSLIKEHVSQ
jgi:phosphoribosylglycinamide formyltransferase-1